MQTRGIRNMVEYLRLVDSRFGNTTFLDECEWQARRTLRGVSWFCRPFMPCGGVRTGGDSAARPVFIWYNTCMILYHGSNVEVREPKLISALHTLDFGRVSIRCFRS